MKMINKAKEKPGSTLRHNDEIREEERVSMAHNAIIISSDEESDSGRRQIPSKPVTSSNKESTFPT